MFFRKGLCFAALFLAFVLPLFSKSADLPLFVSYTSNKSYGPNDFKDEDFAFSSNIDVYKNHGICWVQFAIPENWHFQNGNIVSLNREHYYFCELYLKGEDGRWRYCGNTGVSPYIDGEKVSYNQYTIPIQENDFKPGMKVRMKIVATHSSMLKVSLKSQDEVFRTSSIISLYYGYVYGSIFIIIFFLFFLCFAFKNTELWYIALAVLSMTFLLFLFSGVFDLLKIVNNASLHRLNMTFMLFFVYGGNRALISRNRTFEKSFPVLYRKLIRRIPFITIFFVFISLVYLVFPLTELQEMYLPLVSMLFTIVLQVYITYCTIKFNPRGRTAFCISWIISSSVIFLQQLFYAVRFSSVQIASLDVVNLNLQLLHGIVIYYVSIVSIFEIYIKIQNQQAVIQLNNEEIQEKESQIEKREYSIQKISKMLVDPLSALVSKIQQNKALIPSTLVNQINTSVENANLTLQTISLIGSYKSGRTSYEFENVGIALRNFFSSSIIQELTNLRLNNCYIDINTNFTPLTTVIGDKRLLSLLFKYVLQTVNNVVIPGKSVSISAEYVNYVLTYSVHFYSESLSLENSQRILNLDFKGNSTADLQSDFENLISKWGIQVYVVKVILEVLHGALTITPDFDGNTITARLALAPTTITEAQLNLDYLDSEDEEVSPGKEESQNQNSERVYLLEENEETREILVSILSKQYRTVALANGNEFLEHLKVEVPDLIICSIHLPGKNAFDLLACKEQFNAVPFIVLTEYATNKTMNELLSLGAVDIIEKPFDHQMLLHKVNSILQIRKNQSSDLLNKINHTLKASLFSGKIEQPLEITEEQIFEKPAPESSGASSFMALCTSAQLTKKELEIALLIVKNKTDKEIASQLGMAPSTVAVHNKKIFKKLNVHSRSELTKLSEN